jgi:hypothetical protein
MSDSNAIDFTCRICGAPTALAPPEGRGVCSKHCEDHDYQYERGEGWMCTHCGIQPPADFYDVDPEREI